MRFTDFLRTAVLLFAAAATALAAVSIAGASADDNTTLLYIAVAWWIVAAIAGLWMGRRASTTQGIGTLLANARHSPTLPEVEPGRTMVNRLWPLIIVIAAAAGIALPLPQVPAIGAGYALLFGLRWRKQSRAGAALGGPDRGPFYLGRRAPVGGAQPIPQP